MNPFETTPDGIKALARWGLQDPYAFYAMLWATRVCSLMKCNPGKTTALLLGLKLTGGRLCEHVSGVEDVEALVLHRCSISP